MKIFCELFRMISCPYFHTRTFAYALCIVFLSFAVCGVVLVTRSQTSTKFNQKVSKLSVSKSSQFWDESDSSITDESWASNQTHELLPESQGIQRVSVIKPGYPKCSLNFVHETAHVTQVNSDSLDLDDGSLISYGQKSYVVLDPCSVVHLRNQSGFRVQDRASVRCYPFANISGAESSHVTVSGLLNASDSSQLFLDSSRALFQGQTHLKQNSSVSLSDSSLLRVYEGGYLEVAPFASLNFYRGAALEISEWWQNAIYGHINAGARFGNGFRGTFLDRSSFQVARGNLEIGQNVAINLNKQSSWLQKGQLKLSDTSAVTLGERARLVLGSETRRGYEPQEAPSLTFARRPNIHLQLVDEATVTIAPKTHCLLIGCLRINGSSTWQAGTVVWPSLICYGTQTEAKMALDGLHESNAICIKLPPV